MNYVNLIYNHCFVKMTLHVMKILNNMTCLGLKVKDLGFDSGLDCLDFGLEYKDLLGTWSSLRVFVKTH